MIHHGQYRPHPGHRRTQARVLVQRSYRSAVAAPLTLRRKPTSQRKDDERRPIQRTTRVPSVRQVDDARARSRSKGVRGSPGPIQAVPARPLVADGRRIAGGRVRSLMTTTTSPRRMPTRSEATRSRLPQRRMRTTTLACSRSMPRPVPSTGLPSRPRKTMARAVLSATLPLLRESDVPRCRTLGG